MTEQAHTTGENEPAGTPGRRAQLEAIVSEYETALLRYASRVLRDPDNAQNVVQDAFIRLYRSWTGDMLPSPPLATWLYRVTYHCAVDHLRKESRLQLLHRRHALEQEESVPPNRGEGFALSDAAERAAAALKTLSLREQQLVILKVYEEKSYAEIAEITGLTSGNVGYILHHAMKKLAAEMKKTEPK